MFWVNHVIGYYFNHIIGYCTILGGFYTVPGPVLRNFIGFNFGTIQLILVGSINWGYYYFNNILIFYCNNNLVSMIKYGYSGFIML